MFALNVNAPVFTPRVQLPIFNNGQLSAVRILDSDEYRSEFLHDFNREEVADEDLFNPAVYPVSAEDHEELAAAEAFNREMAELEDLEHQEELRSLLQDRISALQHGTLSQRPAKIASLEGGVFSAGHSRGAPSWGVKRDELTVFLRTLKSKAHQSVLARSGQGKRVTSAKKCNHNINQPLQSGRNN